MKKPSLHPTVKKALAAGVVVVGDVDEGVAVVSSIERERVDVRVADGLPRLRAVLDEAKPALVVLLDEAQRASTEALLRRFRIQRSDGAVALLVVGEDASEDSADKSSCAALTADPGRVLARALGIALAEKARAPSLAGKTSAAPARAARARAAPAREVQDDDDGADVRGPIVVTRRAPPPDLHRAEWVQATLGRTLAWLAPNLALLPRGAIARAVHPEDDRLALEVRATEGSELLHVVVEGALPRAQGGAITLRSERGVAGYIQSLVDQRIGHAAIDERFLVEGDTRLAHEWVPVSAALVALDDSIRPATVRAVVDGARVLFESRLDRGTLARFVEQSAAIWLAVSRRRMGLHPRTT